MPRLTTSTYFLHHHQLKVLWITRQSWFADLSPQEQWALHRFYAITQEMTDAELRLHRRLVGPVDPSLPQRAGRAYAKLKRREWKPVVYIMSEKARGITVRAVVKPVPDPDRYAKAILALAMERQGLTPSRARSELNAVPAQRARDGHGETL